MGYAPKTERRNRAELMFADQRTRFRIAELMEKINNVQTQLAAVPHTLIKALDAELVECERGSPLSKRS